MLKLISVEPYDDGTMFAMILMRDCQKSFFVFSIAIAFLLAAPEITQNKLYSEKCDTWAMGVITLKL